MMTTLVYVFALIASFLWFAAGFRYFSFKNYASAKVMVPKSARTSPLFHTIAAATRFLGGFNGAFALLCLILLILVGTGSDLFTAPGERAVILVVLAAAHFSQYVFNVPVLKNGERQGESYWMVKSGPMYFIFVMDIVQTFINGGAAALQLI